MADLKLSANFETFLLEGMQDVAGMAEFGPTADYLKAQLKAKTKGLFQTSAAWERIKEQLPKSGPAVTIQAVTAGVINSTETEEAEEEDVEDMVLVLR